MDIVVITSNHQITIAKLNKIFFEIFSELAKGEMLFTVLALLFQLHQNYQHSDLSGDKHNKCKITQNANFA